MPAATVTTGSANIKSSTEVTLSGSFANATATPTEVGFYYGTSSNPTSGKSVSTTSSSFSLALTGLQENTKYYYCAYVKVAGTGTYTGTVNLFKGEVKSFTTLSEPEDDPVEPSVNQSWLELPGAVNNSNYLVNTYYDGSNRNYTHLYDKSTYTSLWTAYHLNSSHMGSYSRPDSWSFSPAISESLQVNLTDRSYNDNYSRGHMIPNASRNGNRTMQLQTFYVTNSVPQIQDNFNGGIWQNLEAALQEIAESEEIYIVTGVAFNKVGESKTIKYTTAKDDTKKVPVPNYFYKVVLKVEKSGTTITSASTIGFWFEHKTYSGSYTNYAFSVDQIEQWTGMDFFVNLPDNVESSAESNGNWSTFRSF